MPRPARRALFQMEFRMSEEDRSYLCERAEAELEAAQKAGHPGAVRAHYLMAGYYLDRVYGGGEKDAAALPVSHAA